MIDYNNQGFKLLTYNAPIPLYDNKYSLHKNRCRQRMVRLWPAYLNRRGPFWSAWYF